MAAQLGMVLVPAARPVEAAPPATAAEPQKTGAEAGHRFSGPADAPALAEATVPERLPQEEPLVVGSAPAGSDAGNRLSGLADDPASADPTMAATSATAAGDAHRPPGALPSAGAGSSIVAFGNDGTLSAIGPLASGPGIPLSIIQEEGALGDVRCYGCYQWTQPKHADRKGGSTWQCHQCRRVDKCAYRLVNSTMFLKELPPALRVRFYRDAHALTTDQMRKKFLSMSVSSRSEVTKS